MNFSFVIAAEITVVTALSLSTRHWWDAAMKAWSKSTIRQKSLNAHGWVAVGLAFFLFFRRQKR